MAAKPHSDGIESRGRGTRSTFKALATSVGLSVLFFVVYGWCNWFTSQRSDVGTLFFEWERLIPFVPLMIVPYMSIDLFFVAAPFLCRDDREVALFSKRIAAAFLIAGLCFLLFPLRFAFERPHADGWLGAFFDWFRTLDQPYNLLPSLHITLRTILAEFYARHTRGLLRRASNLWFGLIGLSAVLTYQHHVMDVVAGFALGAYCLYFIREPAPRLPVIANRRIGAYYGLGALLLICLVVVFWPWGAFLIWPAMALVIAAAAYFGLGPGVFHKRNGELPWTTWWALGPFLLGQHLSRLYYRRQCRAWDQLTPQVWIGSVPARREAEAAVDLGVTAVLDLTAEFSEPAPFRAVTYRNIPILDLTAPTREQLTEMVTFISRNIDFQSVRPAELHSAESAAADSGEESRNGIVYVHCKIGYSRTAAAAAAYLLHTGRVGGVSEAVDLLRKARPTIIVRPEIIAALTDFSSPRQPTPP